jgi:hypothetical protein
MELAKTHTDRLRELKKKVEESQEYFRENVRRFEKFMRFVFKSSLSDDEASTLADLGKPTIEFNILEAFISRLRGEFAKQAPNLTVRAADGVPISMLTREFIETIDVIESHLRAVFFDGANDMLDYNTYSDLLAGGFSVSRVSTEYVNEKSFEQNIVVERVFDPTLTFFDPLARKSHKGDGKYCGEIYPMTKDRFEDEFGENASKEMTFTRSLGNFDWSFLNDREKIVLVADYYEKKTRKETIIKLTNGHSVTKKEYEKFIKQWEEDGNIEQPPLPLQERKTLIEYICRYRFCETGILDYVETDYKYLPLVFIDGNSVVMKEGGTYTQMTRPFVYHAEGVQRLKNFAGQTLACELENTVSHKFIAAIESIPNDYKEAWQNIQKPDTLLYNHFYDPQNPNVTLPPPREVMRTPIPPEISSTFSATDQMTQNILGSYDNSQGVNQAQMSGIAFARSAIQSNNSSMPYIVGFIKGLNRIAQIIVDLIPKYYRTPRSLPILLPNGKRSYKEINKKGAIYMNFDPNSLQVKVEAGVNFAMQKEIALQTIIAMTQANQGFAQFFNEEGLPTLLENIDIRGIDQLKAKAEEWMKKQKQQQAQQMQMAQQQQQQEMQQAQQQAQLQAQQQQMQMAAMKKELQSPSQTEVEQMYIQQKSQTDAASIAIKARDSETKFLETLNKIQNADMQLELDAAKLVAENERSAVDAVLQVSEHISKKSEKITSGEQ